MKKVLIITFLACIFSSPIFGQNSYKIFKDNLNEKLGRLSSFHQTYYDEDIESYDPDSLSIAVAGELTNFLQSDNSSQFNIDDFPSIEHRISPDNTFQVLILGYHSGGSAGWIPRSIIIKKEAGSRKVFNLANSECYFYEFYKLKNEIYLCIGASPGSGTCRNNTISVIDFANQKEKYVPAFGGRSGFSICNSDITFDKSKQILTINADYFILPKGVDRKTYLDNYGFKHFDIEYFDDSGDEFSAKFTAKFNGKEFVKP